MRYLLICVTMFLVSCRSIPERPTFPDAVPELMKKCDDLKKIEGDKVAITEMLKVIVYNYSLYYECSTKVDGWQDWYTKQKKLHDDAK